jgi:hypothetical protein
MGLHLRHGERASLADVRGRSPVKPPPPAADEADVRRCTIFLLAGLALALPAAPASAFRLTDPFALVPGNPAHHFEGFAIDPIRYDRATGCGAKPKPGVAGFVRWLNRRIHGRFWGAYRCERWGDGQASLHAEGRAVDWHLDTRRPADRAAARRIIELLLAPDRRGNVHAMARRLGVQEIIWDCSYWGAGMEQFRPYSPCFGRDGTPRKRVSRTIAHRDHIHFGLTKPAAWKQSSFWRATRKR